MKVPLRQSISVKLLKTVFIIYFSLTFLITGLHVGVEYLHTKATVLNELSKIEDTFTPALREVLWRLDEQHLQVTAESIQKLPAIVGLSITDNKGNVVVRLGQLIEGQEEAEMLSHRFSVSHEFGDKQLQLAKVVFYTDSRVIFDRVKVGFLMILLTAVVKSTALIALLLWAFKSILVKPFEGFLDQVVEVDLDNISNQRLHFNIDEENELQQLENTFNTMLDKLSQQKEQLLESERSQQQHLEKEIKKRTRELVITNTLLSQEIQEKDHAKQDLLESEKRFRSIVDNLEKIGLGLLIINSDYRIRFMNQVLIDDFGDKTGKLCYESLTGSKTPCSYCKIDKVIDEKQVVGYQTTLPENKTYDIVATPLTNSDNTVSKMEIFRDITRQKEQELLALENTRKQEQLRNLDSLKTMAGAIAHRFNNSMMAVQGNLDLMLMTLPTDSAENEMASDALQAANGAAQVGSMMLSYIGQRPRQLQTENLVDLVRESVTDLKKQFSASVSLNFFPSTAPLYCLMDHQQMKEVFSSIIINGIESLENETGTIEIDFGTDYLKATSFPIQFQDNNLQDGSYAYCMIRDTGHGISPEDLERIFEPFFTTRFVGRGLGLALTLGIMRTHHGAVTVESDQSRGTTVTIFLPMIESSPTKRSLQEKQVLKRNTVQLTGDILLADDEAMVLDIGKKMLEALGFTVHVAINGREAVEMVGRQDINYRAVLLDISMPEMDGIEAMQKIRLTNPSLPILLTSGYSADDVLAQEKQRDSKPDGFLQKPFQLSGIQSSLERLLSGDGDTR